MVLTVLQAPDGPVSSKTENRIPRHLVNSVAVATIFISLTGASCGFHGFRRRK